MKSYQKYFSACVLALLTQAAFAGGGSNSGNGSNSGAASLSNFAVLAGGVAAGAVTCTDSAVTGDVGVIPPGTFTNTSCTITGGVPPATNAAARTAYAAFLTEYAALAPKVGECTALNTLVEPLAGRTVAPGVYCISDVAKTGTLVLNGPASGTWTFKVVGIADRALTGTNFSVVMAGGGQACNVKWWVDEAATMTTSNFQGTILAGKDISVTGGTFNGNAWAGGDGSTSAPTGAVTLTSSATVAGCGAVSDSPSCKKHHKHHHKGHKGDHGHDNDDNDHHDDDDDDDDGDKKKKNGNHPFNR